MKLPIVKDKNKGALKPDKDKGIIHTAMVKEKPLTVDEERLKSIIRAEMERFLFDQVCDQTSDNEEVGIESGLDNFSKEMSNLNSDEDITEGETMAQADARRKKRWAKKREDWRKEIKKKKEARHKCRKKRVNENQTFQRWKELVFG